jgi:hypothetical protein
VSLDFELMIGISNSEEDQINQEKVASILELVVATLEGGCGCW